MVVEGGLCLKHLAQFYLGRSVGVGLRAEGEGLNGDSGPPRVHEVGMDDHRV